MEQNKDVLFIGGMASGKTTAALHLVDNYGYRKFALADPIKELEKQLTRGINHTPVDEMCDIAEPYLNVVSSIFSTKQILNFVRVLRQTEDMIREEPKPRKRLQFLGTSVREQVDDKFWIKYLLKKSLVTDLPITIDDVRFPNEFNMLAVDSVSIRLEVSSETQLRRLATLYGYVDPSILRHSSETESKKITGTDFAVDADQPLGDMLKEIEQCLGLKK